jgi:hypothetical protein
MLRSTTAKGRFASFGASRIGVLTQPGGKRKIRWLETARYVALLRARDVSSGLEGRQPYG